MSNKIDDIVVELIKDLKAEYSSDFSGIYLFGLFLDGKMHQDEDIELVAIFEKEQTKEQREKIWRIIGKIEEDFDVFIDLRPHTVQSLKKEEELFEEISKEGIFFNAQLF